MELMCTTTAARVISKHFDCTMSVPKDVDRSKIFELIQSYYIELIDKFTYAALATGSEDPFTMSISSFMIWCRKYDLIGVDEVTEDNVKFWRYAKQHGEVVGKCHKICRRHFIALLIRVSVKKFYVHGGEPSPPAAVQYALLNVILNDFSPNITGDEFRLTKLYRKECEYVLKKHMLVIQQLFCLYSQQSKVQQSTTGV